MSEADIEVIQRILADTKSGKLQLPSPPEFAQDLHKAIEQESRDTAYVARIIQYDPGLSTRITQVANSPLFRGRKQVDSCKEAVTRIGLRTLKQLVLSFTLGNAFVAKNSQVKSWMADVWDYSREVAVMSFIIATKTLGSDPHRALMAGLLHNVGELPVLQYADGFPELLEPVERIQTMLDKLRGPLGTLVLKGWKFDDELAAIPTEVEDWLRDPAPTTDYADIVNIARAFISLEKGTNDTHPPLFELPAFKKSALCQLGPEECLQTLKDASAELSVVKALL